MDNKAAPPPPPRRTTPAASSSSASAPTTPEGSTWSAKLKAKGGVWGKIAVEKGTILSDRVGGRVNDIAEKRFGTEHFWPVTGDLPKEMDKCARILRAFTVDGVITEEKIPVDQEISEKPNEAASSKAGGKKTSKMSRKILRKIPPSVIANAQGIVIFTAMRTGFAPFGGAGGTGVVLARLPDGSWSAPASISPNNLSAGFLIGVDVYDCILVLRSKEVVDGFRTHKFTLGAEIGIAAGPWGSGGSIESGKEKAPVYSYIKSKGLYAGIEIVGQVFVERFDENGGMYHWKGVTAGDILAGKVKVPPEAAKLHQALRDAETGKAQHEKGDALEMIVDDDAVPIEALDEGEILKMPPRPDMTDGTEYQSDPETNVVHYQSKPNSGANTPIKSAPPPVLPPRTGLRPPNARHDSSTSHYSDALDTDGSTPINHQIPPSNVPSAVAHAPIATLPAVGGISTEPSLAASQAPPGGPPPSFEAVAESGPPGYSELGGPGADFVPDQKRALPEGNTTGAIPPPLASGSTAPPAHTPLPLQQPQGEMSEAEQREWDEFYAQQSLDAGVQDLNLGGQGVSRQHDQESLR